MKSIYILIALITITTAAAAQKKKHKDDYFNKVITGQYNHYSGIIDSTGRTVKNPTRIQVIKTMISYLNNNWLESSNVYRAEHIHTSININVKNIILNIS